MQIVSVAKACYRSSLWIKSNGLVCFHFHT